MKIKIKGNPLATLVFALPILIFAGILYLLEPDMWTLHGISLGYRWQIPFFAQEGKLTRWAMTAKSGDVDSRYFYARAGDEIFLTEVIDIENGYLYTSMWKFKFPPPDENIFSEIVYGSRQEQRVFTIEENGWYQIHLRMHKFKGRLEISWERQQPDR